MKEGIHVMHLFYRVDRMAWAELEPAGSAKTREKLEALCESNNNASHPLIRSYANVGGKADLAFMLFHEDFSGLAQLHRDLEACFPPGALEIVYSYLSVTELTDYMPTDADLEARAKWEFKLTPGTKPFEEKMEELQQWNKDYKHYRLYPEMKDWDVMCFYPMLKKRDGWPAESCWTKLRKKFQRKFLQNDGDANWYGLDFKDRKQLMRSHATTGRKFAGRISQLITGSTGLDDWEWGVTLMAKEVASVKQIVYEMRFDEVSARYGGFGEFYINLRLKPEDLWKHLSL